ncbi:right-handed parallel beta-helix repeat-containing protein [Asticcacaulis sp. AC402]|uniref:right-handed parallel beta-helix repeat-containing protein n=1 Tax=Asticcacaulis sp. AC402 TaxID=1282361 RepID=UPI0003C3E488|nr:right-handed parallel beta-helix repeat-containing protein [Asticcacaulis sp. AC402]ESQ74207.1 hypothetical protein ABAC402_15485 [Asticcacaulis sp. AC402]
MAPACGPSTISSDGASATRVNEISKAQAAYAAALKAQTTAERTAKFAEAVELYDQAALADAKTESSPAFKRLIEAYTSHLLEVAAAATTPRDQSLALLSQARTIAQRNPDIASGGQALIQIAKQQTLNADYSGSADTLTTGYVRIQTLPAGQRDPLIAEMTFQLTYSVQGRKRADVWATNIADPELRSTTLARVARQRLRAGDFTAAELAPFKGLPLSGFDTQGDALLQAADDLRIAGELALAVTTIQAAPQSYAQRDEFLLTLASEATTNEERDDVATAALGIKDRPQRDRALFELAVGNADTSRLTIAARLTGAIRDKSYRAESWSKIAASYARSHVTNEAQAYLARALAETSFFTSVKAKSAVNANLAETYARFGDYKKALTYADRIKFASGKVDAYTDLVRTALDVSDYAFAEKVIGRLKDAGAGDEAVIFRASLLSIQGRPGDIEGLAGKNASAGTRAWVLAYAAEGFSRKSQLERATPHAVAIEALYRNAKSAADIQKTASAAVFAYAAVGKPETAEPFLADAVATNDISYQRALSHLAGAWAGKGDASRLEAVLAWALDDSQMTQVLGRVVTVLTHTDHYESAARYAVRIPDEAVRVLHMHRLATSSAQALDNYGVLGGTQSKPSEVDRERQVIMKTNGFTYYSLGNDRAGEAVPLTRRVSGFTRKTVSDRIPKASDGNVFVIPMTYSYYNTKFISQVNYVFASIGYSIFPVQAQGTRYPKYVHIESGVFTLETLSRRLAEIGYDDALVRRGSRYQLNLPVLVGPEASLVVSGTDAKELRLNTQSGVYLVNAGQLWFHDVEVAGWDSDAKTYAQLTFEKRTQFRPFIMSWGGSEMNADGTHFHHLGFSGSKGYGFSYSQGPTTLQKQRPGALNRPTGTLVENSFEDMYFGLFTYATDDLNVVGNEYRNNMIYGIDPHDYSLRLTIAYNTTYGTHKKHGIIGSRGVDDSWIVGNMSFDNHGTGVMLDRESSRNLVYANRIWNNGQDGVAVFESSCNIVASNVTANNRGDSVKIRNSTDVGLFRNTFSGAGGSAVNIYVGDPKPVANFPPRDLAKDPYTKFVSVALIDNTIEKGQGSGITATGFGAVALRGNRFIGPTEKRLQGDLGAVEREMSRYQNEGVVVRSSCPVIKTPKTCPFLSNGFLGGLVDGLPPATGSQTMCSGGDDVDLEAEDEGGSAGEDI